MTKEMTQEEYKQHNRNYSNDPELQSKCPVCNVEWFCNIMETTYNDPVKWGYECLKCGAKWDEVYEFKRYILTTNP